jgi:hypothetical protein
MTQVLITASGGLTISSRIEERLRGGELSQEQVDNFQEFLAEVDREFLQHRIITHNAYTRWFSDGQRRTNNCGISSSNFRSFPTSF